MSPLLQTLAAGPVFADTMEDGLDVLQAQLGLSRQTLAQLVAEAVAAGLCADPVRLPPGALQCHWRLELTAKGRRAVTPSSE